MKNRLKLQVPQLTFYVFCLPDIPVAISSEGFLYTNYGGFYSIRNKRIELNIHTNCKPMQIYENLIHEMFHAVLINDPILKHNEIIVEAYVEEYFSIYKEHSIKEEYIHQFQGIIEKHRKTFEQLDYSLKSEYHEKYTQIERYCKEIEECCVDIRNERIMFVGIDGKQDHV